MNLHLFTFHLHCIGVISIVYLHYNFDDALFHHHILFTVYLGYFVDLVIFGSFRLNSTQFSECISFSFHSSELHYNMVVSVTMKTLG